MSRLQRARQGASKKGAPERKSGRGVEVNFWDSPRKNEPRKRVPMGTIGTKYYRTVVWSPPRRF